MKRRIFSTLLILCMVFALLPGAALAAVTNDGLSYTIENGEVTLTSAYTTLCGELEIPAEIDGCPVTKLGSHLFDSCVSLTSVKLPETVREIGDYAFRACKALEDVYLPPAVQTIGEGVFDGCPSDLILFGALDSYAEQYANANNIMFLASGIPFTDVSPDAWYYSYIYTVYTTRLMTGMTLTTFEPEVKMNRAMLATVLYRLEGEPDVSALPCPFTDIPNGEWYTDAVKWCADAGIVNGVTPTTFAPMSSITREQTVTMFSRYCKEIYGCNVSSAYPLNVFTDAGRISPYAAAPFSWAVENHIIDGMTSTTLAPQGSATRAQVATMMVRVIRYLDDEGYVVA